MMKKTANNNEFAMRLLIAIALLLVVAAAYLLWSEKENYGGELVLSDTRISNYEGTFKLADGKRIAIVMDTRGLTQENRVSVYQCGVGFASSLARIGKNITNFAIEDTGCYGPLNRTSVTKCDELIHKEDYIILLKGGEPDAKYYEDHLLVLVPPNNTMECGVKAK